MAATTDNNSQANIIAAINEVSDKAQLLVREEIELAKAEVTAKLQTLARGLAVGVAAGIFVIAGLVLFLHGLSWLAYWLLPVPTYAYFWGFFLIAGILFVVGGIAGYLAARWLKSVQSPTPEMALEEAKLIRETVKSSDPETTI
ncbi:MAG: phage holin family protein [Actinobacteria bacterium]|nr:MAG: phage holin family protein [Actinomycetota bacterium]